MSLPIENDASQFSSQKKKEIFTLTMILFLGKELMRLVSCNISQTGVNRAALAAVEG